VRETEEVEEEVEGEWFRLGEGGDKGRKRWGTPMR
jgi:hypothetical protein